METIIKIDENGFEINGVRHDHPKPAEAAKTWPQLGDQYYLMTTAGLISTANYDGMDVDRIRFSTGNRFRTREEAEECKVSGWWAKRIAQATIDRFCEDNGIENKFIDGVSNWVPRIELNTLQIRDTGIVHSIAFNVRTVEDAEKIIAACESEIRLLLS